MRCLLQILQISLVMVGGKLRESTPHIPIFAVEQEVNYLLEMDAQEWGRSPTVTKANEAKIMSKDTC